ncbi:hypothetical protein [Candidatus Lariskella endosymbiont of Epinotia ramella]|uniref:hypothetical protein n=1 Tax=Candidatus Lariskella endosymbiont of Epinotia ramella TaxID=3066224 RepID=UPI0030CB463B
MDFSITVDQNKKYQLEFQPYIEPTSGTRVKLYTLPECGNIIDEHLDRAIVKAAYSASSLVYSACGTNMSENISYASINEHGMESEECTLGIVYNSSSWTDTWWGKVIIYGVPAIAAGAGLWLTLYKLKQKGACCWKKAVVETAKEVVKPVQIAATVASADAVINSESIGLSFGVQAKSMISSAHFAVDELLSGQDILEICNVPNSIDILLNGI